jgi:hypothetical protein
MLVTGQFKVTNGVFISGAHTVTLQGASATYLAADVNSANTDWTGGTLIILSDTDQTLPSSETYNNLQLGRDAGTGTTVYDILDTGSTINGTWTIDADARVLLTANATGVNKVYDDTTDAAVTFSDNHMAGWYETFTINYSSATFGDKNVGVGKAVSVTGISLSESDAGKYQLSSTTTSTTANITAKALTITAQSNTKVYDDGVTAAAVPVVSGLEGDDTVTGLSEIYDTRHVGTGKTLSVDTYTVNDGNGGLNYAVTFIADNTGVILPAAISYLAFIDQPTHAAAGAVILPAMTVNAYDSYDNLCTNDSSTIIEISIENNPGGGTLSGDTDKALVNGTATFNDLSIDQKGVGYTLVTSSGAVQQDTSDSFNIGIAVWDGSESTAWNTPGNWDIGDTPPASYDVQIPATPNDPVLSGSVTVDNLAIGVGAALSAGSNILTVNGNWANNGTFNAGTSTVIFSGGGNSNISGSTTFNNLSCPAGAKQSLTFENGSTQTIENTFTAKGTDKDDKLILQSNVPGQQWMIELSNDTYDLDFLDVRDSRNLGPTIYTPSSIFMNCIGWAAAPPSPGGGIADSNVMGEIDRITTVTDSDLGQAARSELGVGVMSITPGVGAMTVMFWDAADMINIPSNELGVRIERVFRQGRFVFTIVGLK